jgi:hypothetical protein
MPPDQPNNARRSIYYFIAAVAILLGLWGRFSGLGVWPLNADEYYIARSVGNILRTGLPEYECGGFYTRGLAFQYLVAFLQWAGLTAELSARVVAAVCSVIVWPAIYMLGIRVGGRKVALLAVSVMAVSVWEVDIARFGRMYSPFQAVFVWYMVFFLRYTVDREMRALWPMLFLSILGVLTWEGGLLLTAVNLLPPILWQPTGRFKAKDFYYFLGMGGALVAAFVATRMVDFRVAGTDPFPPGYLSAAARANQSDAGPFGHVAGNPGVIIAFVVAGIFAVVTLRRVWEARFRWPTAFALLGTVACILLHQFGAMVFLVTFILLAGMIHWRELVSKIGMPFALMVIASVSAWTLVWLGNPEWASSIETPWEGGPKVLRLVYAFLEFPDVLGVVGLPWERSAPILGAMLLILLALAALRAINARGGKLDDLRVILLLIVCLVAAASMSNPPRYETRYVFFLYPAAMLVAIVTISRALDRVGIAESWRDWGVALFLLGGLAISGDLNPRRLMTISTATVNFDTLAKNDRYSNILGRSDVRGAARWLADNERPGTLFVNGFPGVDFYFSKFDFAFIDQGNQRYRAYACKQGTVERWGNLPLVSTVEELNLKISGGERVLMVIDTPTFQHLRGLLSGSTPLVRWVSMDGYITIFESAKSTRLR